MLKLKRLLSSKRLPGISHYRRALAKNIKSKRLIRRGMLKGNAGRQAWSNMDLRSAAKEDVLFKKMRSIKKGVRSGMSKIHPQLRNLRKVAWKHRGPLTFYSALLGLVVASRLNRKKKKK